MPNVARKMTATILIATSLVSLATVASATPMAGALAIKDAASASVETVRWRGGWGWGIGGLAAGAIIGGALAAPYYYGPGYYPQPYYPAPGYYQDAPDGDVGYCMQRYRSYDPGSGTYLGNDGRRHSCP
jgi:hypothetical protein